MSDKLNVKWQDKNEADLRAGQSYIVKDEDGAMRPGIYDGTDMRDAHGRPLPGDDVLVRDDNTPVAPA